MRSNKTLLLRGFTDFYLKEEQDIKPLKYLPFVNTINILIGTNNSGKSKFMRELMQLKAFSFLDEYSYKTANEYISGRVGSRLKILEKDDVKVGLNDLMNYTFLSDAEKSLFSAMINVLDNPICYYIPTLRTAHSLYRLVSKEKKLGDIKYTSKYEKIEEDIFLDTIRYFYKLDDRVEIFTGVHLYKEILNTRNSKRETRKKFENFEDFISINFFDGKAIDIIAEFNKDEAMKANNTNEIISIHIEGEKDTRDLHHLGDGIQALILLMYKVFMAEPNSYIFIDEPEINLHPGMQRLFLEQIINNEYLREKKLTYFLSTHSNHFMDLTLEKDNVSIYSFYSELDADEEKKLILTNVNSGDNEVLKNLGVNNSSVFMANCSIWVEGISDRIYIRAFLRAYCNYLGESLPKEDIEFAFFEYAGTNLGHYFFEDIDYQEEEDFISNINAMALSNRILLIADSDNATKSSKKGKRLKKLEDAQSSNFTPIIVRNCREIENFLPNEVWEDLLLKLCNKSLLADNSDIVRDKINRALQRVKSEQYRKNYIGEFLNALNLEMGKVERKYIINASEYKKLEGGKFGTITNKRMLSENFSELNFPWEVLRKSNVIETLTVEIYNFIKGN